MKDSDKFSPIFVIGSAKCGTTSLCDYLGSHPDVAECYIKEPNFFCKDIHEQIPIARFNNLQSVSRMSDVSRHNTHAAFVTDFDTYNGLFKSGRTLDGSTNYIFSESAADQIYSYNRKSKIVAVLRDPLARAFSHYVMDVRTGMGVGSFKEELVREVENYENLFWHNSPCYLRRSIYFPQVIRFIERFGRDQVKVVLFEDMVSAVSREKTLYEICDFLGLSIIPVSEFGRRNESQEPRLKFFNKLLYELGIKNFVRDNFPAFVKEPIKRLFYGKISTPYNYLEVLSVGRINELLVKDFEQLKGIGVELKRGY